MKIVSIWSTILLYVMVFFSMLTRASTDRFAKIHSNSQPGVDLFISFVWIQLLDTFLFFCILVIILVPYRIQRSSSRTVIWEQKTDISHKLWPFWTISVKRGVMCWPRYDKFVWDLPEWNQGLVGEKMTGRQQEID